jgi:small-conductance mechanosensitive channel
MEAYVSRLGLPLLTAGLVTAALFVTRYLLFSFISRKGKWEREEKTREGILQPLRAPSIYWCLALGLYAGIDVSEIPARYGAMVEKTIDILIVMSLTVAVANLATNVIRFRAQRMSLGVGTTGLVYGMVKAILFVLGFLVILAMLGISIAPLLTALGVGGLAVALALKDTLSNLFAGIHLLLEKSIRVGDFVKLESGQEGYVRTSHGGRRGSGCCRTTPWSYLTAIWPRARYELLPAGKKDVGARGRFP